MRIRRSPGNGAPWPDPPGSPSLKIFRSRETPSHLPPLWDRERWQHRAEFTSWRCERGLGRNSRPFERRGFGGNPWGRDFFFAEQSLLLVDARLPALQMQRIGVGLVAAVVVRDQCASGGAIGQGVGDRLSREVVDDEVTSGAEGAGGDEH